MAACGGDRASAGLRCRLLIEVEFELAGGLTGSREPRASASRDVQLKRANASRGARPGFRPIHEPARPVLGPEPPSRLVGVGERVPERGPRASAEPARKLMGLSRVACLCRVAGGSREGCK